MATKKGTVATQFKILTDEAGVPTGEVEFYASVFENVDLIGDRVKKGAFTKSLEDWRGKDAPIPVIFSHAWDDAWAIIGAADPKNVFEDEIGLKVRAMLDIEDNPMAKHIYRLMDRKILKEASFAYDVVRENKARDGANDLKELSIIEVGPTLKGMNPATGDHEMLVKDIRALAERMGLEVKEVPHAEKIGARNSASDASMIQAIHDASMNLGATCAPGDPEEYKTMSETETKVTEPEDEKDRGRPGHDSDAEPEAVAPSPDADPTSESGTVTPSGEGDGATVAPSPDNPTVAKADPDAETKAKDEPEKADEEPAEEKAAEEPDEGEPEAKAEEPDAEEAKAEEPEEEKSASEDKDDDTEEAKDEEPDGAKSDEPDVEAIQRRAKADLLELEIEEDLEV